jgi:ferric-dicitrate binding protein FerR (iron transport regulator)
MTTEIKEHIQLLLIRYLDGTASPNERSILSRYLTDEPGDETWIELMEELMSTEPALSEYDPEAWLPFIEQLKQQNAATAVISSIPPAKHRPFLKRYWWAAAAILLLAAGGAWWRISRSSADVALTKTLPPDLLPGGNKAVLTLSGGKQIILDSAANGLLTEQGNSQVRKLSNGSLAYQSINEKPAAVLYNTLTTPRGGQYQLTLPDGTRVWLNASSSITYPTAFTAAERTVKITGEAYFEVKHNARQPFRVQLAGQLIEDIGTSFNVNAYDDEPEVRTTLADGSIKVSSGTHSQLLNPGQQARSKGARLMVVQADVEQVLAWKNGVFSFRDADLPAVMRQLARWYDIEVEYEGPAPKGTFDGEIGRTLTLNQVLQGLANTRIHYSIINNHKIVIQQ